MNLFQICIAITIIATLAPGFFVFTSQRKRRTNQFCFVLSIVITGWLLALAMASVSRTEAEAAFWISQSTAASALLPVIVYLLRLVMVYPDISWRAMLRRSAPWFLAYAAMFTVCQTSWFLQSATLPSSSRHIPQPVYGPGIAFFISYMGLMIASLVYLIFRDLKKARGIRRTELQFILVGCIFSLLFGVTVIAVSSSTSLDYLYQILPLSVICFNAMLAYGVATRNILEVSYFVRRALVLSGLVVYLGIVYFTVWYGMLYLLELITEDGAPFAHFVAALVVAFSVTPVYGRMHRFANRVFVSRPQLDVGMMIREATRAFQTIATVDELIEAVEKILKEELDAEQASILFLEDGCYVEKKALFNRDSGQRLVLETDAPIVIAACEYEEALVREVLTRRRSTDLLDAAASQMKRLGIDVVSRIASKTGIEGIIVLGPRKLGRIYGVIERQAVEGLCAQLAVSIENAKLYTEVQDSRIYNDILLDRLVGGVIAVNTSRCLTVFNREAQRITRLKHEDVIGRDMAVLPEALKKGLEQTFAQGGNRHVEIAVKVGEEEVPVQYGCTLFHSHTGKVLGALMVFSDQTEIKKLQYQIRRTDRLASLGTLAAGMAHEIKNPLVSLKTFSQLLPERYEDPDFRETFSMLLGEEVFRIDRIVNQLLRFARPAKPSLAPINLHTVADNTLNLVSQQMTKHSIGVVREYDAQTDSIMGDGDMLTQAILNFLLNAIDAMGDSGELILRTELINENTSQLDLWGRQIQARRVRLSIIDNGKGISEEDLLHVFDPFFTTKATGTGLGLSVSHGIIQEHNGVIDMESEVGQGTALHLTFPLISDEVSVES